MRKFSLTRRRSRTDPQRSSRPRTVRVETREVGTNPQVVFSEEEPTPPKVVNGKTLHDFRSLIVDMCTLSVALFYAGPKAAPDWYLPTFKELLRREGVVAHSHPVLHNVFVLDDAESLRRLICKLPKPLQNVAPYR